MVCIVCFVMVGYGLNTETELKMLEVLHQADQKHAVDIVSNYCGAHSVPKGSNAEEATVDVIECQIPAIVEAKVWLLVVLFMLERR